MMACRGRGFIFTYNFQRRILRYCAQFLLVNPPESYKSANLGILKIRLRTTATFHVTRWTKTRYFTKSFITAAHKYFSMAKTDSSDRLENLFFRSDFLKLHLDQHSPWKWHLHVTVSTHSEITEWRRGGWNTK